MLKVGTYQGPIFPGDIEAAIQHLHRIATAADARGVEILCMPEGYLGGYFSEEKEAHKVAFELEDPKLQAIFTSLANYQTTLVIGLNERRNGKLYNTAVVLERGRLLGAYRKACLYHPYFTPGREFPIFHVKGIPFGVLICLDLTRLEPARILAKKGARLIFAPMCNRVPRNALFPKVGQQFSHLIARSYENQVFIATSDIIWDKEDHCPGFASIYSSDGKELQRAKPFEEELLIESIPLDKLEGRRKRLEDREELFPLLAAQIDRSCLLS